MKKLMRVLVIGLVALSLAACSSGNKGGGSSGEGGSTYEIGLAIYNYNDNFMTQYRNEIVEYFKELGEKDGNTYNIDMQDGKNDQANQTEQIDNMIIQKKDLIIANLVDPTGAENMINKAKGADIPVIFINREPKTIDDMAIWPGKTAYVGADATQSGTYQGEMIMELPNGGDVNGDGVISYFTLYGEPGNVDADQRTEYSVKALTDNDVKVEMLTEKRQADWDTEKARSATADILASMKDKVEVIFANNDGMAIGAIAAIEDAGLKPNEDIYVVGVDAIADAMESLKEGKLTGTVLNDHFNQARTTAEVAVKLLAGEEVSPYYWHDYVKVTSEESAELVRRDFRTETIEAITERYAER